MAVIISLLRFELRYHLAQPITWLYFIAVFGQGIWYTFAIHNEFNNELLWINSSANIYMALASPGLILSIISCLLSGQAINKDISYRVTDYLYTTPILERDYFLGKFIGTLIIVYFISLAFPLGVFMVDILTTELMGSIQILQLIHASICQLIPNLFLIVSFIYSATSFYKTLTFSYLAIFLITLYLFTTSLLIKLDIKNGFILLIDPFTIGLIQDSVNTLSVADRNNGYINYSDLFYINRLFWFGISLAVLNMAENQFSFKSIIGYKNKKNPLFKLKIEKFWPFDISIPSVNLFDSNVFFHQVRFEFLGIIQQTIFIASLFLFLTIFIVYSIYSITQVDFPFLLSTVQVAKLEEDIAVYYSIALMVFTVEIVHRERSLLVWEISDTLPTSNLSILLSKIVAMISIATFISMTLFLTGAILQVTIGSRNIIWSIYILNLIQVVFLVYLQWIALAFLVIILTNNRLVSHVICIVLLTILLIVPRFIGANFNVFVYGWLPSLNFYSEISSYRSLSDIRWKFSLVWMIIAITLIVLAICIYNRGVSVSVTKRLSLFKKQLTRKYVYILSVLCFLTIFFHNRLMTHKYHIPRRLALQSKQDWISRQPQILRSYTLSQKIGDQKIVLNIRAYHVQTIKVWQGFIINALKCGKKLFGKYPYPSLTLTEVPSDIETERTEPGQIFLRDSEGWTADTRQPKQLDYLLYIVTREVLKQWISIHAAPKAGLVKNSLAEYLALQSVKKHFGRDRLQERLAQRFDRYKIQRKIVGKYEPTIVESKGSLFVERDRAALVLCSIAELWGEEPLNKQIGNFIKDANLTKKKSFLTSEAFKLDLSTALPDSVGFLISYLDTRYFFDAFIAHVDRVGSGVVVRMDCQKWEDNGYGNLTPILLADAMPLVILDGNGREIYRKMVWPTIQLDPIWIPNIPNARTVVLDPLGTWPDLFRHNNRKVF